MAECFSISLSLSLSMALQPFGPWPLFQSLNPIYSRWDSLDGVSARRKVATYTQNNTNFHASCGIRTQDQAFERAKTVHALDSAATLIGVCVSINQDNSHDTRTDFCGLPFLFRFAYALLVSFPMQNVVENLRYQTRMLNYLNIEPGVATSLLTHAPRNTVASIAG
jgi:hypothetical protein